METNTIKEGDFSVQNAKVQQSSQVADGAERNSNTSQVNLLQHGEQQSSNGRHNHIYIPLLIIFFDLSVLKTFSTFWPLCKMIQENDWKGVEDFVGDHPEALTVNISSNSSTIFHFIIKYCREDVEGAARLIKKLASMVHPTTLERKDILDATVLTFCAARGNTWASEIFVKYNTTLPNILCQNTLPVQVAAQAGHVDTVQYLIQVTAVENLTGIHGAWLLAKLIKSNLYDIALDFLKRYPTLGRDDISCLNVVLETLAQKPLAFASGSKLGRLQRFIYYCIPLNKENTIDQTNKKQRAGGDVENLILRSKYYTRKPLIFGSLPQITTTKFGSICQELHTMLWIALVLLVPCIKVIRDQKLTHMQTDEIVKMICEGVVWNEPEVFNAVKSLHTAARLGISEIANEIIMAYNESVFWANQKLNVFEVAVLHRREKVFNLIYGFRFLTDILAERDNYGNNMLHLAGILLVPPSEVAGAALQMQRELQWFKAVESLMLPAEREHQNFNNQTPRDVFTETHKELVKEGEKWMKETASSCTLAVTLIITVVFAAAFTVPGGNSNEGVPNFLKDQAFLIFAMSDALALFSSITSLLMFLGILTSRYAEEDFLVSLPSKLIIGLITLFFSIATMMVAFGATIYLVLSEQWKWIIIPISLLGCVPVTLFALLQFPLLVDMFLSTYGPSIFGPMK